jgi:thiol-disulfide isomerase/thioredoxin
MTTSRCRAVAAILACSSVLVLPSACARNTKPVAEPATPPAAAAPPATPAAPQPVPVTPAPSAPRPAAPAPLLGHVTRAALQAYVPWQPLFAEPYVPDADAVTAIKASADGITVVLVMATWCPDSKRELPRFFAIMDKAGISESQLTMVGVDRTKKDAEGLTEKWGVARVPTFVFLRDGREVGRVVEKTPAGATLEGEIARVLAPRL